MHEIIYLIQVFILILHCMKQLFEMTDRKQYGCHTYTFSPGGVLL